MHETLAKSAEFTIFVRDRKPFVRFSGKAYVLPRTGQRGIPVLSVNTSAVKLVGLPHRRPQSDRHRARLRFPAQLEPTTRPSGIANERGAKVWSGELAVEPKLNTEVTTAFPVDQALGELKPGVYVMTAHAEGRRRQRLRRSSPRQWFIVSDLGLTAYSGHDGIDVFIHSLASAEPSGARSTCG